MKTKTIKSKPIASSGPDAGLDHRENFTSCPSCDQDMTNKEWDKAATVLVLAPNYFKSGCVSVVSECPKCFQKSWVHHRMGGFEWNDSWPKSWKEKVSKLEEETKLKAFREWGASLCWNCKHLTKASVEYHAWRHCLKGCGPAEKECDIFKPIEQTEPTAHGHESPTGTTKEKQP